MKKRLIALFVGASLVACTHDGSNESAPASPPDDTTGSKDGTEPSPEPEADAGKDAATSSSTAPEDRCLDGQDMDGADVDVSKCPPIPEIPDSVPFGKKDAFSLGAWEIGTTANGATYKYGTLSAPGTNPRVLTYEGGTAEVNDGNLDCWAKGYYRLRKILQAPPAEYVALRKAGFQFRFFQFQTDLRNGSTGYRGISSFQDHLVKWVTVISDKGVCQQPTLKKFREYSASELKRRGLPVPGGS